VAATALGADGDERAFEPLIRMASHHNEEMRIAAARTLGKAATMPDIDALWRARIIDTLSRGLADRSVNVRRAMVAILGEVGGERVIHPLLGALKERDITVRAAAAVALGELKNPDALPGLLARFNLITGEPEKQVWDCIADAVDTIQRAMAESEHPHRSDRVEKP
jgi:HEAT repeat protein